MNSPKTPQQLAQAIEVLVASYVDEARRVVQGAVDQAFASGARRTAQISGRRRRDPAETVGPGKRRSANEISEVRERLYALVCAQPGAAMSVFAAETGLSVRELHRPMAKLRSEGRVRCVGERNMARYFPALGRRPKNSEG